MMTILLFVIRLICNARAYAVALVGVSRRARAQGHEAEGEHIELQYPSLHTHEELFVNDLPLTDGSMHACITTPSESPAAAMSLI